MTKEPELKADETLDSLFGLKIIQKKHGYRYSQDSVQLADFVELKSKDCVIELGTGCGIISLILAKKQPDIRIAGLEIQESLAQLARRNVKLNGLENRVEIIEGDIREVMKIFSESLFDCVVTNPPYRKVRAGLISPHSEKAVARHEILCNMEDVIKAIQYLLKSLGRGVCAYPPARFAELILKTRRKGLGLRRIQFVYPNPDERAELVMVEFIKDRKPELQVLPPLFSCNYSSATKMRGCGRGIWAKPKCG